MTQFRRIVGLETQFLLSINSIIKQTKCSLNLTLRKRNLILIELRIERVILSMKGTAYSKLVETVDKILKFTKIRKTRINKITKIIQRV